MHGFDKWVCAFDMKLLLFVKMARIPWHSIISVEFKIDANQRKFGQNKSV